ncbi:fasciclin domain-containing protein [Novosphingobium tardum]|uniref:Fasciclin domain-containing protein n=1 Tax=Novosphingobium tardum TaxID=1538021 RepID=A0ABV8RNU1_9SPHN
MAHTFIRLAALSLAATSLATLGACSKSSSDAAATAGSEAPSGTLAKAIAGAPGLTTVAATLKDSGLASVFDGNAPYTFLAPDDDAFGKLGDAAAALKTPEQRPQMVAILRSHIMPGFVTVKDIEAALDSAKGKPVSMPTMGDGKLTFARSGDHISVTSDDGTTGKIDGSPLVATNGVVIPVDTVLKKVPPKPAA